MLGKRPQKGPQEDRVAWQPPAEPGAHSEFTVKASEWGEQGKELPGPGEGQARGRWVLWQLVWLLQGCGEASVWETR